MVAGLIIVSTNAPINSPTGTLSGVNASVVRPHVVGKDEETLEIAYILTPSVSASGATTVPSGASPVRTRSESTDILDDATDSLISHTCTHPSGTLPPTSHNHGVVTSCVAGDIKWLSAPSTTLGRVNVSSNSPPATTRYPSAVGAGTGIATL